MDPLLLLRLEGTWTMRRWTLLDYCGSPKGLDTCLIIIQWLCPSSAACHIVPLRIAAFACLPDRWSKGGKLDVAIMATPSLMTQSETYRWTGQNRGETVDLSLAADTSSHWIV